MREKFIFDFNSSLNFSLKNNLVFGLNGNKFGVIKQEESISGKFFTINFQEDAVFITSFTEDIHIKINKEPIPSLKEFQLTVGDIIELMSGHKVLFHDNPQISVDDAKAYLGKMVLRATYKGHEGGLNEKISQLESIKNEFNRLKGQEKNVQAKLERLKIIKKELMVLESENLEGQLKSIADNLQKLENQYNSVKKEAQLLEERVKSKKEILEKKEIERQKEEQAKLDQEEEMLRRRLEELAKKKKAG